MLDKTLKSESNSKSTELIKRIGVENTPFEIIKTEHKIFGALGAYRITEEYVTDENDLNLEAVKEELETITWTQIMRVTSAIMDSHVKKQLNEKV